MIVSNLFSHTFRNDYVLTGLESDKRRPVVVLTRDSVLNYLGEVTVAPVTTTIRNIPSEVVLGPDEGI